MAKTVLVVDDIAFVRKTITEILKQAQYEVVGEASDGADAVNLYQRLKPDIVTMDIVMPQMSGVEAIQRILKIDKKAKIIVISAMGEETLVMEAINAGARDYILKPFSARDIVMTIDRILTGDQGLTVRPVPRVG